MSGAKAEVGSGMPPAASFDRSSRERDTVVAKAADGSPHVDGRAQPGDVLGVETDGEQTHIGDTAEALVLGKAALVAQGQTLGLHHPWTVEAASVTSKVLAALDRADEAAALQEKYGIVDRSKA